MPELIDTHVHLDDSRLAPHRQAVLEFAETMGVARMINIGHDMISSWASVELAQGYRNIWAAVGIHPHSAKDMSSDDFSELKRMADMPKVVAIGEIGLDYHYDYSPRHVQKEVFKRQLSLALTKEFPVVIHQREAAQDTLEILHELGPLPQGGVMHCFSGSTEIMEQCCKLNLHIGLGGPVTFANARKAKEVAAAVPLNRLVLETDCPYLAPHPHRGKPNQPGYLPLVAHEISRLRGMPVEQLIAACTANAVKLFNLGE